jgi:uncharacterized hydrophobic protein (TIGR00341 family)
MGVDKIFMPTIFFRTQQERDKDGAIERVISESTPRPEFFLMVFLSVLMATFGLLIDNAAVVIGSMLIAPILSPVLSLSLGVIILDIHLILRSFYTLMKSIVMAVISATAATFLFAPLAGLDWQLNSEIISRMEPSVMFVAIALVAGFAASFALMRPELNSSLPGVAVSVAVIPPLAVVGIGFATMNWTMLVNSSWLFLANLISIMVAGMLVFFFTDLHEKRNLVKKVVKREDRELERELEKANGKNGKE